MNTIKEGNEEMGGGGREGKIERWERNKGVVGTGTNSTRGAQTGGENADRRSTDLGNADTLCAAPRHKQTKVQCILKIRLYKFAYKWICTNVFNTGIMKSRSLDLENLNLPVE